MAINLMAKTTIWLELHLLLLRVMKIGTLCTFLAVERGNMVPVTRSSLIFGLGIICL